MIFFFFGINVTEVNTFYSKTGKMKRDVVHYYVLVLNYLLSHSDFSTLKCLNLFQLISSKKNIVSW